MAGTRSTREGLRSPLVAALCSALVALWAVAACERLESLGHTVGSGDGGFGGYQAIMWDEDQGVYYGASEVRKDGQAAGY